MIVCESYEVSFASERCWERSADIGVDEVEDICGCGFIVWEGKSVRFAEDTCFAELLVSGEFVYVIYHPLIDKFTDIVKAKVSKSSVQDIDVDRASSSGVRRNHVAYNACMELIEVTWSMS